MTQKENLHYDCIKVQNEYRTLVGKSAENVDLDLYAGTVQFKKYADRRTKAELVKELAIAEVALENAKKDAAVKAWLETDEGKAYIAAREKDMETIRNAAKTLKEGSRKYVSEVVKSLLGEQWDVTRFYDSSMEISIVEKYNEEGFPCELFGHTFTIYFGKDWKYTEEGAERFYRWEMNYGTMGSFELTGESNTRVQLLAGIAKFATDTTIVPELRDYLHGIVEHLAKLQDIYYKLEKEVKNPKMPE